MPCMSELKHRVAVLLFAALTALALTAAPSAAQSQAARHREADALALQAYDKMDQGDLEGAIIKFRAAHKLHPRDKSINLHLAQLLTATGVTRLEKHSYAAAAARFQEALSVEPDFGRAHHYLSQVQFIQFYAQGNKLYAAGKLRAAKRKYALAVTAEPGHRDAQVKLATVEADLLMQEASEEALQAAVAKREAALKLEPDNPDLQQKLANTQTALAMYQALKK